MYFALIICHAIRRLTSKLHPAASSRSRY